MKKILVHCCCAPCTSYVLGQIKKDDLIPVAYFYNPMLKDKEEFDRRLDGIKSFCKQEKIELLEVVYDPEEFWNPIKPYKDKNSIKYISDHERYARRRCMMCNFNIMEKTAATAKKLKYKYFTSTLLCSPYKDHDQIVEFGNEKSLDCDIMFYCEDFRKGYWNGRNFARFRNLYTPGFCGCFESLKEGRLE